MKWHEKFTIFYFYFCLFFSTFIGAHGQLTDAVKKDGGASVSALSLAKEDISRSVLSMLYPIFRRHVLLAKQEAAVRFNDAVGDDLEVSINILDDLNAARDDAMTNFIRSVRKLIPKGSPKSSWSSGFDQKQLLDSLNIYIESRVDQLKIQGVLSRGRKPVDLSFNLFLNHPLGNIIHHRIFYLPSNTIFSSNILLTI